MSTLLHPWFYQLFLWCFEFQMLINALVENTCLLFTMCLYSLYFYCPVGVRCCMFYVALSAVTFVQFHITSLRAWKYSTLVTLIKPKSIQTNLDPGLWGCDATCCLVGSWHFEGMRLLLLQGSSLDPWRIKWCVSFEYQGLITSDTMSFIP